MKLRRLAGCLAAGLITATTLTAAVPAGADDGYQRYVALGDSYTAGPLVPLVDLLSLGCLRSTSSYPKLLADALDVDRFTDVSCSGADTTHMTNWQWLPPFNRPQFNALTADTDLVSLGIGGNDFGVFGDATSKCPSLRASDPTGAPCKAFFTVDGVDTMRTKIDQTQARITTVLNGIKARSPRATVLVIGYPQIAPESGTCPSILPFADGDYAYLYGLEQYLNRAIRLAAEATGTTYVDTFGPSAGHDACAPDGTAWIQGASTDLFRALSYHPRYEGMAGVADLAYETLSGARPTVTKAEQAAWAAKGRELRRQAIAEARTDPAMRRALVTAGR